MDILISLLMAVIGALLGVLFPRVASWIGTAIPTKNLWQIGKPEELVVIVSDSTIPPWERSQSTRESSKQSPRDKNVQYPNRRPTTGIGQVRAFAYAVDSLKKAYGNLKLENLFMSTDALNDRLNGNDLLLLGSPKTNEIAGRFLRKIKDYQPAIQSGSNIYWREDGEWKEFVGKEKNGHVETDYGLIVRANNPFAPDNTCEKQTVVLFSGSHTYGTAAAARYFVQCMHKNKKLKSKTLKRNNIVVLVSANVKGRWVEDTTEVFTYDWEKDMSKSKPIRAIEMERSVQSKTGDGQDCQDCEDLIHFSKDFVAVIDGFTSKTDRRWDGQTGGRAAVEIIDKAFNMMPHDCTAREAVELMTRMIQDAYRDFDATDVVKTDPKQRMAAFFAAISLFRRELWVIGDCQALLGGQIVTNRKIVDHVLANVRALKLELEMLKGATIEQLRQNDTGREIIMPLLEEQSRLQNNPAAGDYWYPVVDGFPIPSEGIIVQPIPGNVSHIVLATDGYPVLKDSLKESEDILQEILRKDPLLFREYKSTKGMLKGNASFDDRAFLKIKLER